MKRIYHNNLVKFFPNINKVNTEDKEKFVEDIN